MSLSFPTSRTGHLVGQGHALPAAFDPWRNLRRSGGLLRTGKRIVLAPRQGMALPHKPSKFGFWEGCHPALHGYFAAIVYVRLCLVDELPCKAVTRSSQLPGFAAVLITIGMAPVESGAGRSAVCFANT
jgi:hypothetical protein